MMKNVKSDTIIRTILTFVALVNSVLVIMDKDKLPWTEDEVYQGVSAVFAVATGIWSWWKNNSFSPEAIKADEYKDELKANR